MTFDQLKTLLLGDPSGTTTGQAFPLGTPENLRTQLEQFVVDALIEIQRYNRCWQAGHFDVFRAGQVMVQNGTSVVTKPDGVIEQVFTVLTTDDGSGWDQAIGYDPVDPWTLRRWMGRFRQNTRWLEQAFTSPAGPEGFRNSTIADNSPYGRALSGVWTVDPSTRRLIVAPWLQSNESLVVKWTGIKRTWVGSDIVSDNPDFVRLVKYWVLQEYGRFWASSDLPTRVATWDDAQADGIRTCEESLRLPTRGAPPDEIEAVKNYYAAHPPTVPKASDTLSSTSTRIVFVGDTGTADANAQAVADLVTDQTPDLVVLAGDVRYEPNSVEDALAPYAAFVSSGKLVAALGNHDLDLNDGADVVAAVGNPGNGRYFSVRIGSIEVFVINDGLNSAAEYVEDDGSFMGSKQWSTIRAMILRSCAPFKVVVLHHPPYTSGTRYSPGLQLMRWASDLEVHAVIAGHTHAYERGRWRGRPHFIVGTGGGSPQDTFIAEPDEESLVRQTTYGALVLDTTATRATFRFLNLAGTVLDTLEVTGDAPNTPPDIPTMVPPDWSQGTPLSPVITTQPSSHSVTEHDDVTLTVVAKGTAPLTYQWLRNGVAIGGATSSSLLVEDVTTTNFYRVIVSNAYGSIESSEVMVTTPDGPPGTWVAATRFANIAEMLAADARTWTIGRTINSYGSDGILSGWDRVLKTDLGAGDLADNGDSILETDDGLAFAQRTWVSV